MPSMMVECFIKSENTKIHSQQGAIPSYAISIGSGNIYFRSPSLYQVGIYPSILGCRR